MDIYSICCQRGVAYNDIVVKTLQMSESSILPRIVARKPFVSRRDDSLSDMLTQISEVARKKRSPVSLFARDLLWGICTFRWKKVVKDFIEEVKPDVLYLPIYASLYMCHVDLTAIQYAGVPVVGHISDDIWNYSTSFPKLSLARLYRWLLRIKVYKLIQKTSYLEVFAQNMKDEYEKVFGKPCFVIGKGVNIESVRPPRSALIKNELIHFVYTGGIGGERYKVLLELGKALLRQAGRNSILDVYTFSPLTEEMKNEIESVPSIQLHGPVNGSEVKRIQREADCLVHVEGFSSQSVFSTRMSFSTKIIDYLATGNVLLALGPREINSIQVLKDRGVAVVVDELGELDGVLSDMFKGKIDLFSIQQTAYNYLITERSISSIQQGIHERMNSIIHI